MFIPDFRVVILWLFNKMENQKISVEILENKIKCYFKKTLTTLWMVYLWWPLPLLASIVPDWWYDRWQNSWSMSENRIWDFAPVSNRKRNWMELVPNLDPLSQRSKIKKSIWKLLGQTKTFFTIYMGSLAYGTIDSVKM